MAKYLTLTQLYIDNDGTKVYKLNHLKNKININNKSTCYYNYGIRQQDILFEEQKDFDKKKVIENIKKNKLNIIDSRKLLIKTDDTELLLNIIKN